MKKVLFALCVLFNVAIAQQPLAITTDKTTSLIFPFPIKYVDRGTKDILVQPVKEKENILLVKAASKKFSETNLSVVTADGHVYEFTVNYTEQPGSFVFHLPANNKASVATYANGILDNEGKRILRVEKNKVVIKLRGVYVKDNVLFYQLELCNHSPLDYDIELLQFVIRDKQQPKRTALQENILTPLHVSGNTSKVKAYNFSVVVVALDKFSIPDAKYLAIQLTEKNGGRHLGLKVRNHHLMKAVVLPELR
jgi:conjugative transposon TraN protein